MFGFKVICWALLFNIFKLRFPPGVSIVYIVIVRENCVKYGIAY
jgi:hypothetical protein